MEDLAVETLTYSELATIRNRKIGFIFQSFNLFPALTVEQNIEVPMLYARVPHRKRAKIALELAKRVGLGHRLGHKPTQLSGGECQRIAIARSLGNNPAFILADEPTGNLDERTSDEIMDLFHELNRQQGVTIVMVTHNMQQAVRVSDHTAFFLLGELVEFGKTDDIFSQPQDQRTEDYITGRFG